MDYKVSCNYYLQIFAVHAIFYFFKGKDMGLVFIKGHVCFEILVTEKAKKSSTLLHTFFRICPQLFLHHTMRINLLNWSGFVPISKNIVFYAFWVVRIYQFLVNCD